MKRIVLLRLRAVALALRVCLLWLIPCLAFGADSRLIDAIKAHDARAIQALIHSRDAVNATQGDGTTALHWAVRYDDAQLVDSLLHAGARVNVANDVGVTPLYLACTNQNAAIVERLLSAEADPNAGLLNG